MMAQRCVGEAAAPWYRRILVALRSRRYFHQDFSKAEETSRRRRVF